MAERIRILELFAGIGACSKALTNLGIEHEIVDAVEIDKYAVASFNAVHGTNFEPQDICDWDKDIECDLILHGSPCQDFSVAGKNAGGDEGSGTRSSLLYESLRIIEKLKPKYVIWENVKNLLSRKHVHNWNAYAERMEEMGYTNYCQVLNAKDYGVPQNRERVFTVSIRLDVPYCWAFKFPARHPLTRRLKDVLESEVDEKYYLSDEQVSGLIASNYDQNKRFYDTSGLSPTLSTMGGGNRQPKIVDDIYKNRPARVYDKAPTLRANHAGDLKVIEPFAVASRGREPQCLRKVRTEYGKSIRKQYEAGEIKAKRSTMQKLEPRFDGCTNTITSVQKDNYVATPYRIRKLTPKECWRLMAFDDEDFERAAKVCSNTQLYKQAGNSIVVSVLEAILKEMLDGQ